MSFASSSDVGDGQGNPSDCILSNDLEFLWRSVENPLVVEDEGVQASDAHASTMATSMTLTLVLQAFISRVRRNKCHRIYRTFYTAYHSQPCSTQPIKWLNHLQRWSRWRRIAIVDPPHPITSPHQFTTSLEIKRLDAEWRKEVENRKKTW